MKWRGVNELREMYLSFFESKAHIRMASASLVPQGDKSLLLINSGMAPLKKFFLGQAIPPNNRVTTCQKCIRTPDIERVGKTARHGTFFEMLGNFSFGDYFKREAIEWAWEFFTEVLEMPARKLYVSVYESDDEAYDIWTKEMGIEEDHMVRMGKEDNFWEHGSGPCGPCSEIYFDRGEKNGCGSPDCKVGCECDRFVEVWNLVFSQFNSDGKGTYTEMEHKNIDTGMGLERLACVMQEVDNLFEVDTVQNIMNHICDISNVQYRSSDKSDVSLRVITDHIRSTVFMIGDGVLPSNGGRGYVLRRLLRRAARHGRLLGINKPFLYEVCDTVINENENAYPELEEKRAFIKNVVKNEEDSFAKTIDKGSELLNQLIDDISKKEIDHTLSGDDAFKLNDTYGFPIDLTMEILAEKGLMVDEKRFQELMQKQKETARGDRNSKANSSWDDTNQSNIAAPKTEFTGYTGFEDSANVVAIFVNGEQADIANEGEQVTIVLDKTPFYAESGGQIGDSGEITGNGIVNITDTKKTENGHYIHIGRVESGSISKGEAITAAVDKELRLATMRNHTTAHILQAVLREVLGEHVHQAGQFVSPERCRFDFSHFSALTPKELAEVERLVNDRIFDALNVEKKEIPIKEAKKLGAMALFGEKYGDIVRVVDINGCSIEFCGGTHVNNTSEIGVFKILSETSVASGVRRIEAVTGKYILEMMNELRMVILNTANLLKLQNPMELEAKCQILNNEIKEKDREIEKLNQKIVGNQMDVLFDNAVEINGTKIISALLNGTRTETLRQVGDKIKEQCDDVIGVFAGVVEEKGTFYAVCSKKAIEKGAHAGKIVQRVSAITGGKGGGRPDSAMAGVGKNYMIDEALTALTNISKDFLQQQ